jgi:hypothetical protein
VENQWGSDTEWHEGGYWLLGSRGVDQRLVAVNVAAVETGLEGTNTYAGEGPINFKAIPLQAWNAQLIAE